MKEAFDKMQDRSERMNEKALFFLTTFYLWLVDQHQGTLLQLNVTYLK